MSRKKNKHFTTWEGLIEVNMNANSTYRGYCIAKSAKGAREELERLARADKKFGSVFHVNITDVKISES